LFCTARLLRVDSLFCEGHGHQHQPARPGRAVQVRLTGASKAFSTVPDALCLCVALLASICRFWLLSTIRYCGVTHLLVKDTGISISISQTWARCSSPSHRSICYCFVMNLGVSLFACSSACYLLRVLLAKFFITARLSLGDPLLVEGHRHQHQPDLDKLFKSFSQLST
jgi:hypothetical protein